jgi:hypothetical protein
MVRIHVTAIAFSIGADPERNTRVQIALWWRDQTPVFAGHLPTPEAIARAEVG